MSEQNKNNLKISFGELGQSEAWLDDESEGQLMLDVYQDQKNIYVCSTMAGVDPAELEVSLNNDMLTIRGKRSREEVNEAVDYFYQECYWGNFSRSIILPVEVKPDKISAVLKDGILTVTLPKAERRQNISIKVNS
ncbi:MAG: Hsp20/alpha crystallin family protein [Patescibacteria group bacterium]|nr:Hsp20/alpha crystallin family protein [Patescibacteria group bacterium]